MALLLETTLGDLVIDLDVEGSPTLCQNILELAQVRYYTQTLIYNIQANRFCQLGDPYGNGTGGACFQGLLDTAAAAAAAAAAASESSGSSDVTKSRKRFLKSQGRRLTRSECQEKGRVVATEIQGIPDTIGSQFLITLADGPGRALDGYSITNDRSTNNNNNKTNDSAAHDTFLSLGKIVEDENNVLEQLSRLYCDVEGRPYVDVRVHRVLVVHNPFEDAQRQQPELLYDLYRQRGVEWDPDASRVTASPDYDRPPEEKVEPRLSASEVDLVDDEDEQQVERLREQQQEEAMKHDAKSRANVLEMLGDLPDADIRAPENVLFVCKLNPVTEDEDLELIFSRFDPNVKAEIIRDHDTGQSLHYAFIEFTKKEQAVEAYFKMNNALVDDRRIKVDFSQSVAHIWDKFNQKLRPSALPLGFQRGGGRGEGRGGGRGSHGGGRGRGRFQRNGRQQQDQQNKRNERGNNGRTNHYEQDGRRRDGHERNESNASYSSHAVVDEFGRTRNIMAIGNDSRSDEHHRGHRNDNKNPASRSRSGSRSTSPARRSRHHRSRSRSGSRSRERSRSRKHHKRNHHDHHHRKKKRSKHQHRGKSYSPEDDHRRKRRYDSEDEEARNNAKEEHPPSKRRYDSEASEEHHVHSRKKHSKHHHKKRRRGSRSRSSSR